MLKYAVSSRFHASKIFHQLSQSIVRFYNFITLAQALSIISSVGPFFEGQGKVEGGKA